MKTTASITYEWFCISISIHTVAATGRTSTPMRFMLRFMAKTSFRRWRDDATRHHAGLCPFHTLVVQRTGHLAVADGLSSREDRDCAANVLVVGAVREHSTCRGDTG